MRRYWLLLLMLPSVVVFVSLFVTSSHGQNIGGYTGGGGTVSSVGLTLPSWLSVAGSPVTGTGTLAVTAATGQTAGQVLGTCGAATSFAPCILGVSDLPGTLVTSAGALPSGACVVGAGLQAVSATTANCSLATSTLSLGTSAAAGSVSINGATDTITLYGATSGSGTINATTTGGSIKIGSVFSVATGGATVALKYSTSAACASGASPAVCGVNPIGFVAIPTGVNPTLQVNTSAVTASSQILLTSDDTLGTALSVTCNSTLATLVGGMAITARSAGASFTISFNGTITTNPVCLSYEILN